MTRKHVAIIGAGPAGVAAALAAAQAGAEVTLIGVEPPGGRANWHSLLPSKVLLTAADGLGALEQLPDLGILFNGAAAPDVDALTQRMHDLAHQQSAQQAALLRQGNVRWIVGVATFAAPHRLQVVETEQSTYVDADAIVIATGSVPIFPPNLKPDGNRIIAPRIVSKLPRLPSTMAVIGGGVTGTEFAYAFARLGVGVTWLVDEYGVLPPFDPEPVAVLVEAMSQLGVQRIEGVAVASAVADEGGVDVTLQDGRTVQSDMAFVAIGRTADLAGLRLEAAGLEVDARQGIVVDAYGRSAVPHIYAAGDVTGLPMMANKALAQGWTAGRHAAGSPTPPLLPDAVVAAVYTSPQVAQVGMTEEAARAQGRTVTVLRVDSSEFLKPALVQETEGFVKLVADAEDGRLLGACAAGAHAGDVLAPVALGIRLGARVEDLAAVFAAYPGLSELPFAAARAASGWSRL
jgi:dihydrolipoamide dehydrogenase